MSSFYKISPGFLLTLFLFLTGCDSQATIVNNLKERDANEIVVILVSHNINAQKVQVAASSTGGASAEVKWDIVVPARQITDAISVLNSSGLPRNKGTTLLDLFGEQGLVPSEMQDRVRFQEGLSEQLANTIRMMDGIVDASVQITFPQPDAVDRKPLKASVLVKHKGILDNPNSIAITKIKRLVASALPDLEIENVTVIADRSLSADVTIGEIRLAEDLEYVSIWGIIIARVSSGSFQLLLYILLTIIFIFAMTILWMCWKFSPFLIKESGYKQLMTLEPIHFGAVAATNSGEQQTSEEPLEEPEEGEE